MTDLTSVEQFIAFQEERALDGKSTTLEDFQHHLEFQAYERQRLALEEILVQYQHIEGHAPNRDEREKIAALTDLENRALGTLGTIYTIATLALDPTKEITQ